MAIQKFKKFYTLMCDQNEDLLNKFDKIHEEYLLNPKKQIQLKKNSRAKKIPSAKADTLEIHS